MGKTNLERQQQMRQRREKLGLKRYEVWIHPSQWPLVKRYLKRLAKRLEPK